MRNETGAPTKRRFKTSGIVFATCASVLVAVAIVALAAPWIAPTDPFRPDFSARFQSPSAEHPFGTDHLGRDILSRTIWGTRVSVAVGLTAIALGLLLGVPLGLLAGYFGGAVDSFLMRISDVLLAFPVLLLALAITAILGPSARNVIIATGIATAPSFARIVRGSVLSVRTWEFVQANRALGASHVRTILWHILPNVFAPIIVTASLYTATVIILEANLGFLGLGVPPPSVSWGTIINDGRTYLDRAPWVALFPGIAIMLTVLALNLLGDALSERLDPRRRSN